MPLPFEFDGIRDLLARAEEAFADRVAVAKITRSKQLETLTFHELGARVRSVAAGLPSRGRLIGVVLDDRLDCTVSFLAAAVANRPVALLSADVAPAVQARRLHDLGVGLLLSSSGRIPVIQDAWAAAGFGRSLDACAMAPTLSKNAADLAPPTKERPPAVTLSTEAPCMIEQETLIQQAFRNARSAGIDETSVVLLLTPPWTLLASQAMLQMLGTGARLAFVESRRRESALHAVQESGATHVAAEPAVCSLLADKMDERLAALSSKERLFWRLVAGTLEGATLVAPDLVRRGARRVPQLRGTIGGALRGVVLNGPAADPRSARRLLARGLTVTEVARAGVDQRARARTQKDPGFPNERHALRH